MADSAAAAAPQTRYPTGVSRLRLAIEPFGRVGFRVDVYADEVELTSLAAGCGVDPHRLLVPDNLLLAGAEPRTVPFARCGACHVPGCYDTEVTVSGEADLVHWDFSGRGVPGGRVSFAADQYHSEAVRAAADHSWETPERTACRLVLTGTDRDHLRTYGMRLDFLTGHGEELMCSLVLGDDRHQVFVRTPWQGRSPQKVAAEMCAALHDEPWRWTASWHPIRHGLRRPKIAGPAWIREHW
ncbi:hypothetical protein [Catellatospora citrea]|uniref:Uncharacterized protein n=1 Tax=Catellatospora citrea TaxID=53366 RepID=A0A8J3K8I1_9ACTN|nr:hypothetical protein [Catellatospora citrea]RKE06635.1 hypothetical protein C8E86_1457 [Catellatospora citrea]GIF98631.1 hypothetical protein Cci01nite_37250 [Catellatospora citrea]